MKDLETELYCPSNIVKHQDWDDIYLKDLPLPNMYLVEIYSLMTYLHLQIV